MLPIPFKNYIPKLLKNTLDSDSSGTALSNKADIHLEDWKIETNELRFLKLAERCPSYLLDELDYMFSADVNSWDTEEEKRGKIFYAIERHKLRSTWTSDAKIIIDNIAGGNSYIIDVYFTSQWILWAQEATDLNDYTTTLGDDGSDIDLGIDLAATEIDSEMPGVICIDVDNDSLLASDIEKIVTDLEDDVSPAYMRIILCYLDAITGYYVIYTNGIIG